MARRSARRFAVGLLVANIEDVFSNTLAKGAMEAAEALDVDLIIFPGKYVGIEDKYIQSGAEFEYQHNVLFGAASAMKLDYLIAAVGTIAYAWDDEKKKAFLDRLGGDVPILSVAAEPQDYDCLVYDNKSGVEQAIDFMAAQGRKHICMIVGELSSSDCRERYEAYRAALEKNGLPFEERYIVSCDVSEMCRSECEMLIRNNPEMDGVYCVNDDIAAVMCKALKEHKKRIGKDVSVAGFDDLPSSSEMDPPLASVRADAAVLGKRAVEKAVNFLLGIKDDRHTVETQFIPRRSAFSRTTKGVLDSGLFQGDVNDIAENVTEFSRWKNEGGSEERLTVLQKCLRNILVALRDEMVEREGSEKGLRRVQDAADDLFMSGCLTIDDVANSYDIIDEAFKWLEKDAPPASIPCLQQIYRGFYRRMTLDSIVKYRDMQDHLLEKRHIDNLFIRDAVMFGSSLKDSYSSILRRMTDVQSDTAYLYIYDKPQTHRPGEGCACPWTGSLMSYCYGMDTFRVPDDERQMEISDIITSRFLPQGRRFTLIAAALFSNEKQYGLVFMEPRTHEFFGTLELVTYQLSSAVRSIDMMRDQERIRLELHSRNMALEQMSKIDELTGIFNRRGFYVAAEELMNVYRGKQLLVVYADMDNLKLVNDNYGHSEGDFSIDMLAQCMRHIMGEEAVIGRMGGDEFAGIALGGSPEELAAKKNEFLGNFNASGQKPYLLTMSMGALRCVCDNSYDLTEALNKADGLLYEAKAKRKKSIAK